MERRDIYEMREHLLSRQLLDKTIYEWVEVPEIYEILLSIKDNWDGGDDKK